MSDSERARMLRREPTLRSTGADRSIGTNQSDETSGIVAFVLLSSLGSWFAAASYRLLVMNPEQGMTPNRLLGASVLYVLTMGVQPFVAAAIVLKWVDRSGAKVLALRPTSRWSAAAGGLGGVVLPCCASTIVWTAAGGSWSPVHFSETGARVAQMGVFFGALHAAASVLVALNLLWLQSLAEELGWRGYLLPRMVQRFGQLRGLLGHALAWSVGYVPLLFCTSYGVLSPAAAFARVAWFVVSCALLGTLLGWLRLSAESLLPSLIANSTLTLMTGLPYYLHGTDVGLRAAIFGPAGWLVLGATIALVALFSRRRALRAPLPSPTRWRIVIRPASPPGSASADRRALH